MKIYRAVKSNQLNQGFGVNNTYPDTLPVYIALGHKGHEGWDWAVSCKDYTVEHGGQCEPIFCDLDIKATITTIQKSDQFGFGIVARTEDKDGIFEHLWWHMDSIAPNLSVGSVIESGNMLGIAGRTGRATGDHLHRELRPLGKDTYGNYYKSQINNGYGGAIDMTPYFENIFIVDLMTQLEAKVGMLTKLLNLIKQLTGLKT